jgi:hypothetical protein
MIVCRILRALWRRFVDDPIDRDIEEQRRTLDRLAAEQAAKIETTERSL